MYFSQNLKLLMEARNHMTNYQLAKELRKSQSKENLDFKPFLACLLVVHW